jgi:hypothetical protein
MATFCDISGCPNLSFRTDKNTRKHYCGNHWKQHSTDIDKRSITQKALSRGKVEKIHKEPRFRKPTKEGWLDVKEAFEPEEKTSLVTSFTPPKWMQDEANDVKKELKPFEGKGELGRWFLDRKMEMTGRCMHCNGDTMILNKEADAKFHWSVSHLFDKASFPSIATHPANWLELCYYSPSCHKNYDDKIIPITELNCFDAVVTKFCILYPLMTREEKRRVPSVLLTYLDAEL